MESIRAPAVAGIFYPDDPDSLRSDINGYTSSISPSGNCPKALIAPHAGYTYSGPTAGICYAQLSPFADQIRRVVIIGPAHRVAVKGIALDSHTHFQTPIGQVPTDTETIDKLLRLKDVEPNNAAHTDEHGIEVHLPFLQEQLDQFAVVAAVFTQPKDSEIDEFMQAAWGGPETLVIISSDLSHFHDYETAQKLDRETCGNIEQGLGEQISDTSACGSYGIRALLRACMKRKLSCRTLDLHNSGDAGGDRSRVVGYGGWMFFDSEAETK